MKKIYISSSWKNRELVREMAIRLRGDGHEVYDFTDPACRKASWEAPRESWPAPYDPAVHPSYSALLKHEGMRNSVMENQAALRWCDLVILLLPCGSDAHADWGYGVGQGKASIVVGAPRAGDTIFTHNWADAVLDNPDDVYDYIKKNY